MCCHCGCQEASLKTKIISASITVVAIIVFIVWKLGKEYGFTI